MTEDGKNDHDLLIRIDENVEHIKGKIDDIKDVQKDHESRIRDNEKFKNRGYGALGLIGAILTVVTIIIGWIITG